MNGLQLRGCRSGRISDPFWREVERLAIKAPCSKQAPFFICRLTKGGLMSEVSRLPLGDDEGDNPIAIGDDRIGAVYLVNDWGVDLAQVTIRHRRGNDESKQEQYTFHNVEPDAKVGPVPVKYTVGSGSPFDYWWIKFTTQNGAAYTCKSNFYCSISSDDDGTVYLRVDGSTKKMYVKFSKSSGCNVELESSPG